MLFNNNITFDFMIFMIVFTIHPPLAPQDLELQDKGDGNTGLMLAAREGHLPVVSALLLQGARVNAANK